MGKMMIYLVIGMGIITSFSVLQLLRSDLNAQDNSSENHDIVQARNLAQSGVDHAIMKLNNDSAWMSGYSAETASEGRVVVNLSRSNSRYPGGPADPGIQNGRLVVSTGTVQGVSVTIRSIVDLEHEDNVPPGLGYAMMSDKDLSLTGGMTIRDDGNPAWNADVHTNQLMTVTGTNSVSGYGTYTGSIASTPTDNAAATFVPNVYSGGPTHYWHPRVDLPEIDPAQWAKLATRTFMSNTKLSGNITLGSKDAPEIVYVNGNLEIAGTVTGYGVFLVSGDLILKGNTTVAAKDPSGNNLGIIAGGKVRATGNVDITATILSKDNFEANGNVSVTGSITTKGLIKINGDVDVKYRPMLKEITGKVWAGQKQRPVVLSMYE